MIWRLFGCTCEPVAMGRGHWAWDGTHCKAHTWVAQGKDKI